LKTYYLATLFSTTEHRFLSQKIQAAAINAMMEGNDKVILEHEKKPLINNCHRRFDLLQIKFGKTG
jgi:hypothetical protein